MKEAERITTEILARHPTLAADPRLTVRPLPEGPDAGPWDGAPIEGLAHEGTVAVGGMGILERGRQLGLDREVAVKRLRTPDDPIARELLAHEALLTARIAHPNVVPVHDLVPDSPVGPLLTMKLLLGRPWIETLAAAPRTPDLHWLRRQVSVLRQVCHALEYAHDHGVLHLDVKPDNVMVNRFGEVRLFDWGIAFDLANDPPRTKILGTPAFMAPEMLTGEQKALDVRTDVYLVGGCLYELIWGHGPHEADSYVLSVASVLEGARFPETQQPKELVEICERALARSPDDRFPDMRSLREALDAFDRHLDSIALTMAAAERLESGSSPLQERERLVHRFQAALTLWPGNRRADEHLQGLRRQLLDAYLDRGDVVAAQRAADALEVVPPEQARRLDLALAERETRQQAPSELERLAAQDLRADRIIGVSVLSVWAVLMAGVAIRYAFLPLELGKHTVFVGMTALTTFAVLLMLAFRATWGHSIANRTAAMVVIASMATNWWNHLASVLDQRPLEQVYAVDILILGTATLSASALDPRRVPIAMALLTIGALALSFPSHGIALSMLGVQVLVFGGLSIRFLRRRPPR